MYKLGTLQKFRSCYHKFLKFFYNYRRRNSVTSMLFDIRLPSFNTLLNNVQFVFTRKWFSCSVLVWEPDRLTCRCHITACDCYSILSFSVLFIFLFFCLSASVCGPCSGSFRGERVGTPFPLLKSCRNTQFIKHHNAGRRLQRRSHCSCFTTAQC